MPLLTWQDHYDNRLEPMDRTHREFVVLVGDLEAALDRPLAEQLALYDTLVAHTVEHFAQEDRWMLATGFTPENCHTTQHRQVLDLLREVRRLVVDEGRHDLVGKLLPELAQWFDQHAQMADAALAYHLGQVGYDIATGQTAQPPAAEAAISGCGSQACAD